MIGLNLSSAIYRATAAIESWIGVQMKTHKCSVFDQPNHRANKSVKKARKAQRVARRKSRGKP